MSPPVCCHVTVRYVYVALCLAGASCSPVVQQTADRIDYRADLPLALQLPVTFYTQLLVVTRNVNAHTVHTARRHHYYIRSNFATKLT